MTLVQRRLEEKQHRIESIAKAALDIFSEKGYSDCNMNDIAARARLGKATLYYYFPTKEALFRYLIRRETASFYHQAAEKVKEARRPQDALHSLMFFYLDYFTLRPELLRLFFPIGRSSPLVLQPDRQWEEEAESLRRPLEEHLRRLFQDVRIGVSSDDLVRLLRTFLIGASVKLVQGYSPDSLRSEANLFMRLVENLIGDGA